MVRVFSCRAALTPRLSSPCPSGTDTPRAAPVLPTINASPPSAARSVFPDPKPPLRACARRGAKGPLCLPAATVNPGAMALGRGQARRFEPRRRGPVLHFQNRLACTFSIHTLLRSSRCLFDDGFHWAVVCTLLNRARRRGRFRITCFVRLCLGETFSFTA